MYRLRNLVGAVCAVFLFGFTAADAALITYTETATVSGTLNGIGFHSVLITIIGTGSTTSITGSNISINPVIGTVFQLSSGGSGTFTDPIQMSDNHQVFPAVIAFSDVGTGPGRGGILGTFDSDFQFYDLSTPLGPITNSAYFRADLTYPTTNGSLNITSADNSTFNATFTVDPVPEPGSLAIISVAALGIAVVRRRTIRAIHGPTD